MMIKEAVLQPATPAMSAGTPKATPNGAKAQDRIARRAYELYERRGRQDGLALEDWLQAERQLAGASSQ
ncbi:DUF2934 domain-containing protein [Nitrospira sp. NS4]|uniref:DUF2934 domain-containing protein n=1 Tax=Nitrospira sp. NS4 TaxID=3414498 RepID=UPI003C2B5C6C